ncbi:MAG: glycosyltransferase family 1 protein, partial [Candidatus Latescibacterota bacterium]
LLRRGRFRFYLAPNYLGFPPGRAPGTIRIAVVHDLIPWELPEARAGGLRWRLFYRFPPAGRYLLRTAPDRLVAVSEATRAAIVRRFGGESERIAVVPGAPSPRFGPEGEEDERLLAALGLPRPYLLYVGRKDAHKNLGRLVEAHRALPGPMRRRFPLVIAGADIPAGPGLLSIPRVDDEVLPSLYRAATLLVLPSLAEGFGLTMVEAFACGTPALASRISPLVEHGGRAARYFDPRDAGEMARVMRETLEDEAALRAMRAAAREQASLFSWEKSASVMKELLRTLDSGQ